MAARAAAAGLGLFFGLAEPTAGEPGWRPGLDLYPVGPGPLDDLIESARSRLGGCERRVAASLLFQGYAARLFSPQLGCLATSGVVPAVPADRLRWRQPPAELIELGLTPGAGYLGSPALLLPLILRDTFAGHLDPLAAALRSRVRLPAALLRDNASSAFIGALRLLGPRLEPGWRDLATLALADPRLAGTGTLRPDEPAFVRRSCCLYYRAANGSLCGDCPLAQPR
jgi:hypothetical protein